MVSDEIFRITYAMRQKIHQNNDREKADLGITASTFESLGFKPDAVFLQMITDCNQRTSPERTFPPQTKSQKTQWLRGLYTLIIYEEETPGSTRSVELERDVTYSLFCMTGGW
ncbi:predicted protein [Pyrenophora tritici-repentis Pt-1C-BFP]|uniref:Uncharacterized protein n=1 Tax=Pyrenophora tritici-repentis (strain Pt-1C-BFP) TaxID=426418 RepID=B2WKK6_PYRTR|nr:uncharacterized protein PTRG_10516 [Pyrenophora tritici-repentis Pt-1C-BFP]EDU43566.1 predicted protein [Pyrenophora tritici-repentis Pt-1C-BFP]